MDSALRASWTSLSVEKMNFLPSTAKQQMNVAQRFPAFGFRSIQRMNQQEKSGNLYRQSCEQL